ncbi:short-chain collagen C4-like [Mytilus trossulus]|uniref:short-chain collagen C4-like n=1 Tax=Mytilus trossulus TaxID=6551 RepID=UPI003003EE4D
MIRSRKYPTRDGCYDDRSLATKESVRIVKNDHCQQKLSYERHPKLEKKMFTYSFATVTVALVVCAYGHDCTKYSLTPSDQSLIDMMKHYLHTSRKADCPVTPSQYDIGVTYVRWGKKTCPGNTDIVYAGQAGGNYYTNKGGGSNYLCLPSDPENGKEYSYANDVLYGAEYEIASSTKPSGLSSTLSNKEVPCAVCRRKQKMSVLMIAGRKSCYKGWKSEYSGFLMSENIGHNIKDYICVDGEAEPLDNRSSDENGALFYPVRAKCGSLRCPPYKDNTEVLCTVCTK